MKMKRIKALGLALAAVFAMSAVAASAASAVEGPFWKVEGVRLASGVAKEIRVTGTSTRQELYASIGVRIKCEKVAAEATPTPEIVGKAAGTGGTSVEKLRYTGCTVEGDGPTCKLEGGEVKTENLENREGYEGERTGNLLTGFKPEGANKVFAKLKFEKGTCTFGSENNVELASGKVLGVICFDLNEAGAKVSVTANQAEHLKPQIECPVTKIAKMFYEEAGGLKAEEAGLTGGGGIGPADYVGNVGIEVLEAGVAKKWGVFTG
jgi:hypothetical protein